MKKFTLYVEDNWNKCDMVAIFLFIVGVTCRSVASAGLGGQALGGPLSPLESWCGPGNYPLAIWRTYIVSWGKPLDVHGHLQLYPAIVSLQDAALGVRCWPHCSGH